MSCERAIGRDVFARLRIPVAPRCREISVTRSSDPGPAHSWRSTGAPAPPRLRVRDGDIHPREYASLSSLARDMAIGYGAVHRSS